MGDWKVQEGLKYAKSDEWIKVEGDEAVVGISDYAQDALSDLVYAELPDVGDAFDKGAEFGTVESVKASAPLNLPAAGEIIAINQELDETPELMNSDPYGAGWVVRIKLAEGADFESLLDAEAYSAYCQER